MGGGDGADFVVPTQAGGGLGACSPRTFVHTLNLLFSGVGSSFTKGAPIWIWNAHEHVPEIYAEYLPFKRSWLT